MKISIRCHPCAPVATGELEGWLGAEAVRIRDLVRPDGAVRVMRLTQELPSGAEAVGWLVDIDTGSDDHGLDPDTVETVMRDMRLLGLQPAVLEPAGA